jgi:hypothetical protein
MTEMQASGVAKRGILQERVEAVAKGAGFKETAWSLRRTGVLWSFPDGTYEYDIPNFPLDIAACERWILPEFYRKGCWIGISGDGTGYVIDVYSKDDELVDIQVEAETLAEAIFLAAEQLMKLEGKDE